MATVKLGSTQSWSAWPAALYTTTSGRCGNCQCTITLRGDGQWGHGAQGIYCDERAAMRSAGGTR